MSTAACSRWSIGASSGIFWITSGTSAVGALYGQMDDGERFAFFSKAVVSVLPMLEWRPEVIHCNDWQTALVPIYLKTVAENVSTVFTIHNIEYQGKYGADTVEDLFGLNRGDWYESGVLQMDGCVNLMKGAMVTADAVTTVSPPTPPSCGRAPMPPDWTAWCAKHQWKFSGVLNGIDMVSYDPECDPDLPARYGGGVGGKTLCKAALQQELGLAQEEGDTGPLYGDPAGGTQGRGSGVSGAGWHHGHRLSAGGAGR